MNERRKHLLENFHFLFLLFSNLFSRISCILNDGRGRALNVIIYKRKQRVEASDWNMNSSTENVKNCRSDEGRMRRHEPLTKHGWVREYPYPRSWSRQKFVFYPWAASIIGNKPRHPLNLSINPPATVDTYINAGFCFSRVALFCQIEWNERKLMNQFNIVNDVDRKNKTLTQI